MNNSLFLLTTSFNIVTISLVLTYTYLFKNHQIYLISAWITSLTTLLFFLINVMTMLSHIVIYIGGLTIISVLLISSFPVAPTLFFFFILSYSRSFTTIILNLELIFYLIILIVLLHWVDFTNKTSKNHLLYPLLILNFFSTYFFCIYGIYMIRTTNSESWYTLNFFDLQNIIITFFFF